MAALATYYSHLFLVCMVGGTLRTGSSLITSLTSRVDTDIKRTLGGVLLERLTTEGFEELGTDHGLMFALGIKESKGREVIGH